MNMRKVATLITLVIAFTACGGGQNTEALKNEVLDIHDEVMPLMGEVMSLKKKVLAKSQEMEADSTADQETIDHLVQIADALENANKSMMTWMNDWGKNSSPHFKEGADKDQAIAFLEKEKVRVNKVKKDILSAIDSAKEALK